VCSGTIHLLFASQLLLFGDGLHFENMKFKGVKLCFLPSSMQHEILSSRAFVSADLNDGWGCAELEEQARLQQNHQMSATVFGSKYSRIRVLLSALA
jgi:hypothetical protein